MRPVLLLLALILAGCTATVPRADARWRGIIKIGVVAPYSGPAPADGLSLLAGARAAADALNRQGGVEGYRVEIVASDELNPATPADLAVDPDIVAVVGHLLPDAKKAVPVYRAADLGWLTAEPIPASPGVYSLVAGEATAPLPDLAPDAARRVAALVPGAPDAPTYAALGYDAIEIAAQAAGRAASGGTPSRASVAAEFSATSYSGLLGPYGPRGPEVTQALALRRRGKLLAKISWSIGPIWAPRTGRT